ncbi:MAG: MATE family efflux transporter [Clostridia bacterium]|nr:MATE family efflux transporter [Clostridia bacterium]
MFLKKFIGTRDFYRKVLAVSVPIMIQSGITNFVSLLDNIMVGWLGTESMSGVSIVNQFIFVFNLLIFGAISAAGIFTAQYHGLQDVEGVRHTFRFKFLINVLAAVLGIVLFACFDDQLISLFLRGNNAEGDLALTLSEGKAYLQIMLIGLIPYALSQVYASTMRETERTMVPMVASIVAVTTNFVLNSILIFGLLGAPALGVRGAAIATVVSRFAELGILVVWGHTHKTEYPFLQRAFRSMRIPKQLFLQIAVKGLPLMSNELFWAIAVTLRNQCYSTRGLEVVAAQNICSTVVNVVNVVYMSIGCSIAIIVGNLLGAGKLEEAKDADRKMMAFSVTCSTGMGLLLILFSGIFPFVYGKAGAESQALASYMMIVSAVTMPFGAFAHSAYFTLRSGGKVLVTLLFDSVYMWAIVLPVSFALAYGTGLNIFWLFALCQGTEVIKAAFGFALLKRGTWVKQLVSQNPSESS